MPVVRVALYEGRTPEKKREVAEAITEALVRVCGSKRDGVHVIFDNVKREDWVIGGAAEFSKGAAPAPNAAKKAAAAKKAPKKSG